MGRFLQEQKQLAKLATLVVILVTIIFSVAAATKMVAAWSPAFAYENLALQTDHQYVNSPLLPIYKPHQVDP